MKRNLVLWLLPRYATGALPAVIARRVRRAIDDDADLAAAYHALRFVDRAHGGGGLSGAQKDLLLGAILDATPVTTTTSTASSTSTATSTVPPWRSLLMPLSGIATCAVVLVGLASDDLQSRGDDSAPLGVRVRCMVDGAVVDDATAGARQTGADLECPARGLLAFSTTNLRGAVHYAFVVGLTDSGERRFLPPFGADTAARALPAGSVDDVVNVLAPVPADVTAVFVLLDDAPFAGDDIERRLQGAARGGLSLSRLDRLPLDVAAQGRLTLRVAP